MSGELAVKAPKLISFDFGPEYLSYSLHQHPVPNPYPLNAKALEFIAQTAEQMALAGVHDWITGCQLVFAGAAKTRFHWLPVSEVPRSHGSEDIILVVSNDILSPVVTVVDLAIAPMDWAQSWKMRHCISCLATAIRPPISRKPALRLVL